MTLVVGIAWYRVVVSVGGGHQEHSPWAQHSTDVTDKITIAFHVFENLHRHDTVE